MAVKTDFIHSSTDKGRNSFTIHIKPPAHRLSLNLREIWQYRELLYILTWRDVKVRYKQTVIGMAWAVLQPLLIMVVFSIVFGNFIKIPTNGVPYPIFTYTGLLPWTFFSTALNRAGASLVYDSNLITKVYFPRLIVPTAAVLGILVDFMISFLILMGLMFYFRIEPTARFFTLPLLLLLTFLITLGSSLWLAALNVKYRDISYILPFLTQVLFFVSPVVYPSRSIPDGWRILFGLNPMVGILDGFRWAVLGTGNFPTSSLLYAVLVTLLVFNGGLYFFRRMEYEFADVV